MKFALLATAALASAVSATSLLSAEPLALARPVPVASYTLEVRLDTDRHRLKAHGSIELVNYTSEPLRELYFHLYLNAFKNDDTLFLRSPFGAGRSGEHGTKWGYIDVKRLYAREQELDLWPGRSAQSPGDPNDETDVRVPLALPLAPGAALHLDVEFEAQLPELVERTGYAGDFHFIGQWFPKLARLRPDGTFAHFAFHPQAEFSADFGRYDVTIDVPADNLVGATGMCREAPAQGGRKRVHCRAEDVHDFAWTAWSGFVERSRQVGPVLVRSLTPPGYEACAAVELEMARFGLEHFSAHYGPYPYSTLTLVHPPRSAPNAGGMEYPTLITTGGPWFTPYTGVRAIEAVTLHELGHQWFYGLLASDEHAFPFLDEGINSYAEHRALESRFGNGSQFAGFGLELSAPAFARTFSAARAGDEQLAQPAANFVDFRSLAALVYSRSATLLSTLERVYGRKELDLALADYAARARFNHPEPRDLLEAVRGRLGDDAARVLERALFERATVDYLVRDVRSTAVAPRAGIFDEAQGRKELERRRLQPPPSYVGRALLLRHGSLELPVELELRFADGSRQRRRWDGKGATYVVDYRGPAELVGVTVDPEFRVLLDDDLSNNAAAVRDAGAPRALERLWYWAELALTGGLP